MVPNHDFYQNLLQNWRWNSNFAEVVEKKKKKNRKNNGDEDESDSEPELEKKIQVRFYMLEHHFDRLFYT